MAVDRRAQAVQRVVGVGDIGSVGVRRLHRGQVPRRVIGIGQGPFQRCFRCQPVHGVVAVRRRSAGIDHGVPLASGRVGKAYRRLAGRGAGEKPVQAVVGVGRCNAVEVFQRNEIAARVVGAALGERVVGRSLARRLVEQVEATGGLRNHALSCVRIRGARHNCIEAR